MLSDRKKAAAVTDIAIVTVLCAALQLSSTGKAGVAIVHQQLTMQRLCARWFPGGAVTITLTELPGGALAVIVTVWEGPAAPAAAAAAGTGCWRQRLKCCRLDWR